MEGRHTIEVRCEGALTARAFMADGRVEVVAQAAFALTPGQEMALAFPPALSDADLGAVAAEGVHVRIVGHLPLAIYAADGRLLWSSVAPSPVLAALKGDEWVVAGAAETAARSKLPTVWAVAGPAGEPAIPEVVLRCCALTIDLPASLCLLRWHGSFAAWPGSASMCVTLSTRLAPVATVGAQAPMVEQSFESTHVMTDDQHAAEHASERPAEMAATHRADESPLAATASLTQEEVVGYIAPFELAPAAGARPTQPSVVPGAPWERAEIPRQVQPPGPFESTVPGTVEVDPEPAAIEPASGLSPQEQAAAEARAQQEALEADKARREAQAAAEARAQQEALEAEEARRAEQEAAEGRRLAEKRRAEEAERFKREQEEALRAEARRREAEERKMSDRAKKLHTDMYGAFKRRTD